MEIERKMNMPASAFFDKIMESVLYDVYDATGKKVTVNKLENMEYVKRFSQNSRAKLKIEKVEQDRAYYYKTSTTRNDFVVKYDITPLDEKTCQVHYQEAMTSYGTMQKMNDALFGAILGFFKKRRFKQMLKMIEESYQ